MDQYKIQLHELIFDLCYYGKLEYFAVYDMPVQYRTFYIHKLGNMKEKEKYEYDKASGKQTLSSPTNQIVRGPQINSHHNISH